MYALADAATPAGMVAANKAAEVVSTGSKKGLRIAKSAVGFALQNQKKIEQGVDFAIGWFDPTPGLTDFGKIGGAASHYVNKLKEKH